MASASATAVQREADLSNGASRRRATAEAPSDRCAVAPEPSPFRVETASGRQLACLRPRSIPWLAVTSARIRVNMRRALERHWALP
jgi:hypothetical protein